MSNLFSKLNELIIKFFKVLFGEQESGDSKKAKKYQEPETDDILM